MQLIHQNYYFKLFHQPYPTNYSNTHTSNYFFLSPPLPPVMTVEVGATLGFFLACLGGMAKVVGVEAATAAALGGGGGAALTPSSISAFAFAF